MDNDLRTNKLESAFPDYDSGFTSNGENLYALAKEKLYSWMLTGSPWPVLTVAVVYLMFVWRLGPKIMKNRDALNLKCVILIYNLIQTFINVYLLSRLFVLDGALDHILTYACHPMERTKNPFCIKVAESAWWYLFSKIMDLFGTVFFILRKKDSHVTFLHVYHHTNMVLSTWFFTYYIHAEQLVLAALLNVLVHVIMYGYYFLAALGPRMQKYLWWKIYVTRLQMLQFILIILYMAWLLLAQCDLPKIASYYGLMQGVVFFSLFANFYVKTYISRANEKNSATSKVEISSKVKNK